MGEGKIAILGKVTDFDGNPLQDAAVGVKNNRFQTVYETRTNTDGEYRLCVKKNLYMALAAFKDYKTKYLEYWAWNIPAYQDLQIDPRIGGMEVYAMNAFRPQGAFPSLFIYFRPMSLKRFQVIQNKKALRKSDIIDISPNLSKDDIEVRINKRPIGILELNRVKEYAGGIESIIAYLVHLALPRRSIMAYLVQSTFPFKSKKTLEYTCIDLTARDAQTGEKGEACLFWRS
jgi:hypothetical protein